MGIHWLSTTLVLCVSFSMTIPGAALENKNIGTQVLLVDKWLQSCYWNYNTSILTSERTTVEMEVDVHSSCAGVRWIGGIARTMTNGNGDAFIQQWIDNGREHQCL